VRRRRVGELFDALADDYPAVREEVGWSPWPHVEAALGDGRLDGWRVLDVGCGDGEVLAALAARGAQVVGVDASPQMCAAAQARGCGPVSPFALGEGQPLGEVVGGGFDVVIALGCLEYVEDGEAAVAELVAAAKVGGAVLYTVELRGPDLSGGNQRAVPLFDGWVRYRRSRYEVQTQALALLDAPEVAEVPGYWLRERAEWLTYARVIGYRKA
jgi:SAM-dependent methyltransferase